MNYVTPNWINRIFAAKIASRGGPIRRKIANLPSLRALIAEVERRGFHSMIVEGQIVITTNGGHLRIVR